MRPNFLDLNGHRLILGSKSPRRKAILAEMCLEFIAVEIGVDESFDATLKDGGAIAEYLADKKSLAYPHELEEGDILITTDTVVVKDGAVMNKPADAEEAVDMISRLQDSTHEVVSAVCLRGKDRKTVFSETTRVEFGPLDDADIRWYVQHFRPFDKAGGYGIQEWIGYIGITRIEGTYPNVMGFPARRFFVELKKWIGT